MTLTHFLPPLAKDEERAACIGINPKGFHLRKPPEPAQLTEFVTSDEHLFETIHMGSAVVDDAAWRLSVDGLVERPYSINLEGLKALPSKSITAFHECYGSPLKPATENLLRVGNVRWTGVPLSALLARAQPQAGAAYVWSEGLDSGEFAGVSMDRYQKDLPIAKALSDEVLVAYAINGQTLRKERGGPVRLVVPGWFGTNSTKWLSKLSLQAVRAPGPFTTRWYNEKIQTNTGEVQRPVWGASPNALISAPADNSVVKDDAVHVTGWAWSENGVVGVELSIDDGVSWQPAQVSPRIEFAWQRFEWTLRLTELNQRSIEIIVRATDLSGEVQPLREARNSAHRVTIIVQSAGAS
jgi:DMSO/TMAO reductase YedYZ molybdopterin-dependent catalytic subunit